MRSLRSGLIVRIWMVLAAIGCICLGVGFWQAQQQTQRQLDYQMQQIAQIVAGQPFQQPIDPSALAAPPLSPSVHISHDEDDDVIVVVRDKGGHVLYASSSNRQLSDRILPPIQTLGFQTVSLGEQDYRVFVAQSADRQIEVAQSYDTIREAEGGIALATLLPLVLLLPVLAIVIGFTITRQLRPLRASAQIIAERPALAFDPLPAAELPAEIRPLVDEINRLLVRLKVAMEREQRFVTDAAHALRTPLTALQLQADVLEGGKDVEDRAARVAELRAGIRRVTRLSEQLLTLARTEGDVDQSGEISALDPTLEEIGAFYQVAAQSKGVELQVEVLSQARVLSSRRRLTLIFGNLLDNAVRYTDRGGTIQLRSQIVAERASIEICDEGRGLPPEEIGRVFERFYRVPGDESGGSGLGLATVAGLVKQVHGEVTLQNRTDRPGLVATVWLPLVTS
jgi:two-component system, OmpR family, sensor kinase